MRQDLAKNLVNGFLADAPAGGWLPATVTAELLGCYGIPLADGNAVTTGNAAGVEVSLSVLQEQVFGPLVPVTAAAEVAGCQAHMVKPADLRHTRP